MRHPSLDVLYAKRIRRISQDFIFLTPFSRRQGPPRLAERPRASSAGVEGVQGGGGGGFSLSLSPPSSFVSRRSRCRRPPPPRDKREPRRARACGAPGTGARLPTKVRFFQSFRSFISPPTPPPPNLPPPPPPPPPPPFLIFPSSRKFGTAQTLHRVSFVPLHRGVERGKKKKNKKKIQKNSGSGGTSPPCH